jgi:hypothetical protein
MAASTGPSRAGARKLVTMAANQRLSFCMKILIPLIALTTFSIAQEIETVPLDKAQNVARKIMADASTQTDLPFAMELDVEKPAALKGGKGGLLVIPDKKLTAETLANATKESKPLGQLWMHHVVPSIAGSAPDAAKLRSHEFTENGETKRVEVYFLSINKDDAGALTLALTAKGKEPLIKVPLVKTDAAASTTPVAVTGHKEDDNSGVLVLTVFGSYKADITVTRPRE